ncbi:MAG: Ig-like domain-containing protein [Eubacteriales bacterium]|nr:Ig-like domain-containing protein [Eubacteriales bacterium]
MKKQKNRKNLFMVMVMFIVLTMSAAGVQAAPKLNKKSITIIKGQSYKLKVSGVSKKITWSSANKKVAAVAKNGKVTAKKAGTTRIYAKYGEKKLSCKVKVVNAKLNAARKTITAKKSYQLKVKGTTAKASWSSNNKAVATVSSNGKVTAKKAGTATITCKIGVSVLKAKITVKKAPMTNSQALKLYRPILQKYNQGAKENYKSWTTEGKGALYIDQFIYEHFLSHTMRTDFYYAFCDLANDGVPELLIGTGADDRLLAVYGYKNGQIKLIEGEARWLWRTSAHISTDKRICIDYTSDGAGFWMFFKDKVKPNSASYTRELYLVCRMVNAGNMEYWKEKGDGTKEYISANTYNKLRKFTPMSFDWKKISTVK